MTTSSERTTFKTEDLSPEQVSRLMAILETTAKLDLDRLEAERQAALSPKEKLIRKMETQGNKGRVTRALKAKGGPKKQHWRTRRKKYNAYHRQYQLNRYHEILKPKRRIDQKKALQEGGWWEYLNKRWDLKFPKRRYKKARRKGEPGKRPTFTREEWDRVGLEEKIGDRVPVFFRYDKTQPLGLYNCYVVDSETRQVLFDGKEQALKDSGAAL